MPSLVIIGGGASGLAAAVSAGREGVKDITVIERNERPARKLMITGKGRCNLTNNCDRQTLLNNVNTNSRFLFSAFSSFSSADTMAFFEGEGVTLKTERGNRVFPTSDKAVTVVDALVKAAKKYAKIINGRVVSVNTKGNCVKSVVLEDGREIPADAVIVSTGGISYPLTGSTGDGYKIAQELGHTVTSLKPSLVRLVCHEGFCTKISGLSLKNVTLSLFCGDSQKPVYKDMGEMLFTHDGVSGPLVLSCSAHIKNIKDNWSIKIDLKPALTEEQLDKRILRDFEENSNRDFANSLFSLLPKSLIPIIIKLSGIDPKIKVNQIGRTERQKLLSLIKGLTLHITDFGPIQEAVVTSGGISVKELNPKDMSSKIKDGLFFSGEIIDVDAYTGGFNLQIAFSTGFCAGKGAALYLK